MSLLPSFAVASFLASSILPSVQAHVSMWTPAMYGYCDAGNGLNTSCDNTATPVNPLSFLDFGPGTGGKGWWFHGAMDQPPEDGIFEYLPAGGTIMTQNACNKALTTYQDSFPGQYYACDTNGPLHTEDTFTSGPTNATQGCALAIAYKSDPTQLVANDFTVISTNRTCPFYLQTAFDIPADLPACPEGGCHAFWLWIHEAGAYGGDSRQFYLTPFRAKITGTTNTTPLPAARVAQKCIDAPDICVKGPKLPHYWMQLEQNNAAAPDYDPPTYNEYYGFADGAQNDLHYVANPTTESSFLNGWTNLGCYTDYDYYSLKIDDWDTTAKTCIGKCIAAGYTHAGTEYGSQCMCYDDTAFQSPSQAEPTDCNMACSGNSTEICGGAFRVNLWTHSNSTTTVASSTVQVSNVVSTFTTTIGATPSAPCKLTLQQRNLRRRAAMLQAPEKMSLSAPEPTRFISGRKA